MGEGAIRGERYGIGAILFHWTIAVLVIANLLLGLFHESLLDGIPVIPTHKAIGITVLALSLARLGWRLAHRPPALPADLATWERRFAKAMHWLFYGLTILLPLTGWIMTSHPAHSYPIRWFGFFTVPPLSVSASAAETSDLLHGLLGYLMALLLVLHVAAALHHHFQRKNHVMARMLPTVRRNG